jgi:Zn-finger nucleic acid-binding protein
MICPRCETSTLREIDRDGVAIDQCPDCRGVWLDRGELEKLVNRAVREIEDAEARAAARSAGGHDQGRDTPTRGRPERKKRSWFESIEDLFGG